MRWKIAVENATPDDNGVVNDFVPYEVDGVQFVYDDSVGVSVVQWMDDTKAADNRHRCFSATGIVE